MSIESVMPSNHLILCCPLLLPSIFPASASFLMSWLFASGGQSIRVLASASVLPMNIQDWFGLGLADFILDWLISLLSRVLSRVFSRTSVWKPHFFSAQPSLWSSSHIRTWLPEKPQLWLWTFVSQVMSLLFNTLSRFVIAFLPRSKCLLISWLQSLFAVILEPKQIRLWKWKKVKSLSHVWLFATPWTVAC